MYRQGAALHPVRQADQGVARFFWQWRGASRGSSVRRRHGAGRWRMRVRSAVGGVHA